MRIWLTVAALALASPAIAQTPAVNCEAISGGQVPDVCRRQWDKESLARRDAVLAPVTAGWTSRQKQALADLMAAAEPYYAEHVAKEVDLPGSIHELNVLSEIFDARERLARDIASFDAGYLPKGGAAEQQAADSRLNAIYEQLREKGAWTCEDFRVSFADVQETQRLWLPVRETWVKLAAARWPQTSPEAWRAFETGERIREIEGFLTWDKAR